MASRTGRNGSTLRSRGAYAAALIALIGALTLLRASHPAIADTAALQTDQTGYVAGQVATVQATGFAPGDPVTVTISHSGAADESDPTWTVFPDVQGTFTLETGWAIDPYDAAGNTFTVTAMGAAGSAESSFQRMAIVQTDKFDYLPGQTALIRGEGFLPGETVSIRVEHSTGRNDGAGHLPFDVPAEIDGRISATWLVGFDDSEGAIFRLTATGLQSGLTATTTLTDPPLIVLNDDQGPDDYPGQKDLNFLAVDYNPGPSGQIAVLWGWDDTAWSGNNTGDGCALFDTNGDGRVNYALCVTVGDTPATFQSLSLYSCGNGTSDRCDQPLSQTSSPLSTATASVVANSDPFGGVAAHTSGNTCKSTPECYTADTVANVTVALSDVGGSGTTKLINVCSYPSQQPNSDPSECVVTPNAGFLTIVKSAAPNDGTAFVFNASEPSAGNPPVSSWTIDGSGMVQLISYNPTTTLDLNEAVPAGWQLTSASCEIRTLPDPTSTGTDDAPPAQLGPTSKGVQNFEIRSGLETVCTFTNSAANASIDIEKHTNGEDADSAPGPSILVGDSVSWEYICTNTGDVDLSNVVVTDDVLCGEESCPITCPGAESATNVIPTLAVGETVTCTASGTADVGQYANTGTAVGSPPIGDDVSDSDPSHYVGEQATPGISTSAVSPVTVGADIHDTAAISGLVNPDGTGTITFKLYSDAACATAAIFTDVVSSIGDNGNYDSGNFTTTAVGSYYWVASFSGDGNNEAKSTACGDSGETSEVNKAPTTVTTQVHDTSHMDMTNGSVAAGTPVHDSATVSGQVNGLGIGGTVTYHFFTNGSCSEPADSDETVDVGNESAGQTLAPGSYSYRADYNGDPNYLGSTSDCEPFTVVQKSIVTNSGLCTFDVDSETEGSQFRLIYTPDTVSWKLNASNPGQYYYNVFFNDGTGSNKIYLKIPYPFVTQGAVPIHIYSGVTPYEDSKGHDCLTPGTEIGHQNDQITLDSYGEGGTFGDTVTVEVTFSSPTGFAYVNIHLDYGLKGDTGCSKGGTEGNDATCTTPTAITIPDLQEYTFEFTDGVSDSATVSSRNVFKRDPGIGGLVTERTEDGSQGDPVPNVTVQIDSSAAGVHVVETTDEDGWYMWQYKYTGKPALFTVTLPAYDLAQDITLKSNHFEVVSFTVPPAP